MTREQYLEKLSNQEATLLMMESRLDRMDSILNDVQTSLGKPLVVVPPRWFIGLVTTFAVLSILSSIAVTAAVVGVLL